MQIIIKLYNPKAYSDQLSISKDIDAKSLIEIFFGGDNRYMQHTYIMVTKEMAQEVT